jgi:UPF0716 protein FxsA
MFVLLVLAFIVLPIAELYVIIQVGGAIGALETIGLLILISVLGAWLTKREGLGVLRRIRAQIDARRVPAKELLDGFLILLAGALLLTPGFITDVMAVLLLLPPVRALIRATVARRMMLRIQVYPSPASTRPPDIDVADIDGSDLDDSGFHRPDRSEPPGELGQ